MVPDRDGWKRGSADRDECGQMRYGCFTTDEPEGSGTRMARIGYGCFLKEVLIKLKTKKQELIIKNNNNELQAEDARKTICLNPCHL